MSERIPVPAEVGGLAEILLSHLDSAYNLARWLVRNDDDAEDVVQEAYLRAFQYSDGFRGGDARAWLFTIVRNAAYTWLRKTRALEPVTQFDEQIATTGVDVPDHPGARVVGEHPLQLARGQLGPVGDGHLPGVDGAADADAAAVVDAHPGGP